MRLITTLTLCALAAAVTTGPAHAADMFLKFGPVKGAGAAASKGRENRIDVLSYHFSARKGWDGTVKGGSKIVERASGGSAGYPTGKRQHQPSVLDKPLHRGSVTLTGTFADCVVGSEFADVELIGGGTRYTLSEVTVTKCPAEGISLDYAKVQVRGWDTATKRD